MELAYVGVEVADRVAFDAVMTDVAGLIPGEGPSGTSSWRNDERAYRIAVHQGTADDARYFGIELTETEFDAAVDRLNTFGATVTAATSEGAADRKVNRMAYTTTPFGPRVELVTGLQNAPTAFESELVPGGFNTAGVGFGHLVFQTGDERAFELSQRFITDGLGFEQSDWFEGSLGPTRVIARFYHCNSRHHTVALAYVPVPINKALNHIMLETVSEDNVGAAFDRAWAAGTVIDSGIGKHDNDRMFSFYVVTPAGFRLEFGAGAREIVEPWTENRRYDRPSIWGHLPVTRPQPANA